MGMNTPKTEAEARRYARDLAGDLTDKVEAQKLLRDLGDAIPTGQPEFSEHQCWTSLMIYPSEEDPTKPSRAVCSCGSIWRMDEEHQT